MRSEQGFSIVSAMVGLGLSMVMLVSITEAVGHYGRQQKLASDRGALQMHSMHLSQLLARGSVCASFAQELGVVFAPGALPSTLPIIRHCPNGTSSIGPECSGDLIVERQTIEQLFRRVISPRELELRSARLERIEAVAGDPLTLRSVLSLEVRAVSGALMQRSELPLALHLAQVGGNFQVVGCSPESTLLQSQAQACTLGGGVMKNVTYEDGTLGAVCVHPEATVAAAAQEFDADGGPALPRNSLVVQNDIAGGIEGDAYNYRISRDGRVTARALEVRDGFRLVANDVAGRVLTADAIGNASWTRPVVTVFNDTELTTHLSGVTDPSSNPSTELCAGTPQNLGVHRFCALASVIVRNHNDAGEPQTGCRLTRDSQTGEWTLRRYESTQARCLLSGCEVTCMREKVDDDDDGTP
jgi:hypothetical protein